MTNGQRLMGTIATLAVILPLVSCGGGGGGGATASSGSSGGSTSSGSSTSGGSSSSSASSTSSTSSTSGGGTSSTSSSTSSSSSSSGASSSGVGPIAYALTNQDSAAHAPPSGVTAAQYDYNRFTPNAANFPAVGGYYVDPVFGAPIRRLTNVMGNVNGDQIYAHHWANADGTLAFTQTPDLNIVSVATGARVYLAQPAGTCDLCNSELHWDALDPDKYYYFSGANLMRRNLAAQTSTLMKTFPAALENLGGSLNIQSGDGRYFVVQYGGTAKVWDSQSDAIYAGPVTPADPEGWVSITPSANYVVTAAGPNWEHYAYRIDHGARSVAATPIMFWNQCGDHGDLLSASDGKDYLITFNCYSGTPGVYRVDLTKDESARTPEQQRADNQLLLATTWNDDGHFSAVSRGALRDWVFVDTENGHDGFDGSTAGWTPYMQEVVAIDVLTLQVRRLAHHRSRGTDIQGDGYYDQPRVSCSWDGSVVLWTSNFNIGSPTGYADMYALPLPIQ